MDQQTVDSVCQTIQAAQELLDSGQAPAASDRPSKKTLAAVADKLKTDAAKVGIMFGESGAGSPGMAAAGSLMEGLQQTAIAVFACCQALNVDAGETLKNELSTATKRIAEPLVELIRAAGSGTSDKLKQHVGKVWQGCDELKKCSQDNRSSIFKQMAATFIVIKDTLRELKELQESSAGGGGGGGGAGAGAAGGEEALADVDEYEVGDLSAAEAEALAAACEAVEAAGQCLKCISKVLLGGPPLLPSDALDGWESLVFHCRSLRVVLEEFGAALYPPQDAQELGSAAAAMANCVDVMLDECPELDRLGSAAVAHQAKLRDACARVTSSLAGFTICEAKA